MDGSNHIRYGKVMPDMKYVNREIPILEVAGDWDWRCAAGRPPALNAKRNY